MEALREKLIQASTQRDLSGVASCVVAVWFGNRVDSLPPKQRDSSIVEPLLDAISSCRISVDAVNELNRYIAEKGFPQVMPPLIETRTLDNAQAGFVVNLVADPKAGHKFASGLPFELSLARQTTHTGDSVRALIQRIVDQHDKP